MKKFLGIFGMTVFFLAVASHLSLAEDESLSDLQTKAKQGDVQAQIHLGIKYAGCFGVLCDAVEALKWFHKAADKGSAEAAHDIGNLYASSILLLDPGTPVQQNDAEAVKWWRRAAEQGYIPAQNRMGRVYENGLTVADFSGKYRRVLDVVRVDYPEAMTWYRKAADQGDAQSQAAIGDMYAKGRGVQPDPVQAYVWYTLAVQRGYANAGNGCQRVAAVLTPEKMAQAQYGIGKMYASGDGGAPKDLVRAYMWYSLGSANDALNSLTKQMTPAQIAEAKRLAQAWKSPSAVYTQKDIIPAGLQANPFLSHAIPKPPAWPVQTPAQKALSSAGVGDVMPDGSIYLGKFRSVRWFVMSSDAKDPHGRNLLMNYNQAQNYAKNLRAHGHADWVIPDQDILEQMFGSKHKGVFNGTYNESGKFTSGWYWSSTLNPKWPSAMLGQLFSSGNSGWLAKTNTFSVRCVRAVAQP